MPFYLSRQLQRPIPGLVIGYFFLIGKLALESSGYRFLGITGINDSLRQGKQLSGLIQTDQSFLRSGDPIGEGFDGLFPEHGW